MLLGALLQPQYVRCMHACFLKHYRVAPSPFKVITEFNGYWPLKPGSESLASNSQLFVIRGSQDCAPKSLWKNILYTREHLHWLYRVWRSTENDVKVPMVSSTVTIPYTASRTFLELILFLDSHHGDKASGGLFDLVLVQASHMLPLSPYELSLTCVSCLV